MKFLLGDLGLRHDPGLLKDILRKSVPATMQDVVLVFVTVSGLREGKLMQEVFTRKIVAQERAGRRESAIQASTAAGLCAALDLFRRPLARTRLHPAGTDQLAGVAWQPLRRGVCLNGRCTPASGQVELPQRDQGRARRCAISAATESAAAASRR
jgi:hypothetical protein